MDWRRTARRGLISTFLALHIAATVFWILPPCAIRQRFALAVACYIHPLGLWQYWGMFAPNPPAAITTLEALVVDAYGLHHNVVFPRKADFSGWRSIPRYKHPKYVANLLMDEFGPERLFAARHAVRSLDLPASAYPVVVQLNFVQQQVVRPAPAASELPAVPRAVTHSTYRFDKPVEVQP